MIDAVTSYHSDTYTCGVAKFSALLAKRLGVPHLPLGTSCKHPLVSLKCAELSWDQTIVDSQAYDLFFHDAPPCDGSLVLDAVRVFAGNAEVAACVGRHRADVIEAWCPSLLECDAQDPIRVVSFGMAHKLRVDLYAKLKQLLDESGEPYRVYVSAALHDGLTFRECAGVFEELKDLFGPSLIFLGTLSDQMVMHYLRTSDYVAAFFEKGVRANNTTAMAALEVGARLITNTDKYSPWALEMYDVTKIGQLPHVWSRDAVRRQYGWDRLVELIRNGA